MNGTVGGELKDVKRYIHKTREYPAFKNIDFKWSERPAAATSPA